MKRRDFLKACAAAKLGALPGSTALVLSGLSIPTPVRAEPTTLAIISTAVTVVNLISSLSSKGDGMAQRLQILNVKLNEIIWLQHETVKAIGVLAGELDGLKAAIPNMLVSESFRQQLVVAVSLSNRINLLLQRVNSKQWTDDDKEGFSDLVKEVRNNVSNLNANLFNSNAGSEEGIDLVRHATAALYTYYPMVQSLVAIEESMLGIKLQNSSRKSVYLDTVKLYADALDTFDNKHIAAQFIYEWAKREDSYKVVLKAPQWRQHENSFIPGNNDTTGSHREPISHSSSFRTSAAFGPCTHGHQSNEIEWANNILQGALGGNFSNFEINVPMTLSGVMLYRNGAFAGFESLNINLGTATSTHFENIGLQTMHQMKRRGVSRTEVFANDYYPVAEFNCPGMPIGDRFAYAQLYADQSKTRLAAPVAEHVQGWLDLTARIWTVYGLDEIRAWIRNTQPVVKSMSEKLT